MPDLSDTDLHLEFSFEENIVLHGTINRIYAPLIVEEIAFRLPIEGKAAIVRNEMQITLGISKGNAKPTNDVKRGEIAYVPLGDTLNIYFENMHTYSLVNVLGTITSGDELLDSLKKVRRGSKVEIRKT
jgi:hypothetical protein